MEEEEIIQHRATDEQTIPVDTLSQNSAEELNNDQFFKAMIANPARRALDPNVVEEIKNSLNKKVERSTLLSAKIFSQANPQPAPTAVDSQAEALNRLCTAREQLLANPPKIFGQNHRTHQMYILFLDVIPRNCFICKVKLHGATSNHLVYCKKCAFVECTTCAGSHFASTTKLNSCLDCKTSEWPYLGNEADAPSFFLALWRRMGVGMSDYNVKLSKPMSTLTRLMQEILKADTTGMKLDELIEDTHLIM